MFQPETLNVSKNKKDAQMSFGEKVTQSIKKLFLLYRLTSAHDETWSRVFGVDSPGNVGVVRPA